MNKCSFYCQLLLLLLCATKIHSNHLPRTSAEDTSGVKRHKRHHHGELSDDPSIELSDCHYLHQDVCDSESCCHKECHNQNRHDEDQCRHSCVKHCKNNLLHKYGVKIDFIERKPSNDQAVIEVNDPTANIQDPKLCCFIDVPENCNKTGKYPFVQCELKRKSTCGSQCLKKVVDFNYRIIQQPYETYLQPQVIYPSGNPTLTYYYPQIPESNCYPNYPIYPNYPTYPIYPNYPTYPIYPNYPSYPNYPLYPIYPNYPSYPNYPTYPIYPNYPNYPIYPNDPIYPIYPNYPTYPIYPTDPIYPDYPVYPVYPIYPTQPSQTTTENYQTTTDSSNSWVERPTDDGGNSNNNEDNNIDLSAASLE